MGDVRVVRVALLGFGAVNKAFVRMLVEKEAYLLRQHNVRFEVVAVATRSRGSVARGAPALDLRREMLPMCDTHEPFADHVAAPSTLSGNPASDAEAALDAWFNSLAAPPLACDIVVEAVPVCYATAQPALGYARRALANGMHFVSANKGPVVHGYDELRQHERAGGPKYRFESAVMDGCPVFNMARACILPATRVTAFTGILNSTSNIILSAMEAGVGFDDAVRDAQERGIAETDPSGDVDGWDAAVKCLALARVLFTTPDGDAPALPRLEDIPRASVRGLTVAEVQRPLSSPTPHRYKMVCSGRIGADNSVTLAVRRAEVPQASPLYGVAGASAAVQFEFEDAALAPTSIVSSDPTNKDTAFGLLVDCLACI